MNSNRLIPTQAGSEKAGIKHIPAMTGLLLILLAALTFSFAKGHYSDDAFYPMTAPLLTGGAAHYEQKIWIATSETYAIRVACSAIGPLDEQDVSNASSNYETIPCDMSVTISDRDKVIFKQRALSLHRYATSYGKIYYELFNVDIEKSGQYDLKVDSYKDLSFLNSTEPKLQLSMGAGAIESGLALRIILFCVCVVLAVSGIVLILGDFIHTRSNRRKLIQFNQPGR